MLEKGRSEQKAGENQLKKAEKNLYILEKDSWSSNCRWIIRGMENLKIKELFPSPAR